jgi:hypothetical protein
MLIHGALFLQAVLRIRSPSVPALQLMHHVPKVHKSPKGAPPSYSKLTSSTPMHSLAAFTLLAVSTGVWASGLVNVPFNVSSVQPLGIVSDAASNPDLGHDGGGGATQAGYHVMVFADSQTNKPGFSFAHNNMAYFGYVGDYSEGKVT